MRLMLGVITLLMLTCLAKDAAAQEPSIITIRTVLDVNRSNSYEPAEDTLLPSIDLFVWKDANGDSSFNCCPPEELYWNVDGSLSGEATLSVEDAQPGDKVCAGEDFGPRIPESYLPYQIPSATVCSQIDPERQATVILLNQEWPALIVAWSFVRLNDTQAPFADLKMVGPQSFKVWVDADLDGRLDSEPATLGATRAFPQLQDGASWPVGQIELEIAGLKDGDAVCVQPSEAPSGYHMIDFASAVAAGAFTNCQVLTSLGISWDGFGNPVWPGRPSALFLFSLAEGPAPTSLPNTGGPP